MNRGLCIDGCIPMMADCVLTPLGKKEKALLEALKARVAVKRQFVERITPIEDEMEALQARLGQVGSGDRAGRLLLEAELASRNVSGAL
jgi:hypothetical protein